MEENEYLIFDSKTEHFPLFNPDKYLDVFRRLCEEKGYDFKESLSYVANKHFRAEKHHKEKLGEVLEGNLEFEGDLPAILKKGERMSKIFREVLEK